MSDDDFLVQPPCVAILAKPLDHRPGNLVAVGIGQDALAPLNFHPTQGKAQGMVEQIGARHLRMREQTQNIIKHQVVANYTNLR